MKNFVRLILFKGVIVAVEKTPLILIPFLAQILTFFMLIFAKKDKKRTELNIVKIFKLASHSSFSKKFIKQVFFHQIISGLETIKITKNPELLKIDGFEELQSMMEKLESFSQGKIYVTAHLGSWEINGMLGAKSAHQRFYALAKPAKIPAITGYMEKLRSRNGVKVLWTDKASLFRSMLHAMKSKEWLSFVMDQKPDNRIGTTVDFFGLPTVFVNGPAAMAIKFDAPVLGVYCVRLGSFHYRVFVDQILPANHRLRELDTVCQKMADSIERAVRLYPEQWCWNYKRWNF